jgi:hypothetical protein
LLAPLGQFSLANPPGIATADYWDASVLAPHFEQLAEQITTTSANLSRSFFLPEVCNMPLGMAWPTAISFDDFYSSIQSLKGGYSIFLGSLQAIKPQLMAWFAAVNTASAPFICPSFPLLEIHSHGFPALSKGDYPDSILGAQAFLPLIEMLNGFIWHLMSDLVLATGSVEARQVFSTFLK